MGQSIGPITNVLSALRGTPEFGQARLRGDQRPAAEETTSTQRRDAFAREDRPDPNQLRAGFGDGTISPLTAAFRTIDRTVQGVRETQPSLDEIRERFQSQASDRRAESFRETRGEAGRDPLQRVDAQFQPQARRVNAFAETDPLPRQELAPGDALDASARTQPAPDAARTSPDEFRAQRLEASREQDRAGRPRIDVRV